MEAYLDSLQDRESKTFDLIVGESCSLPGWIQDGSAYNVVRHGMDPGEGLSMVRSCARAVRQYLSGDSPRPVELRQITQPRWHAPGVLLGSRGHSIRVCTRASASNFTEYRSATGLAVVREFAANNVLGRSVFLSDAVYTPRYGGVSLPVWSSAELITEPRTASSRIFNPEAPPDESLFARDSHRVLTVGRVSKKKGIDILLEVAERLPDWEFVVLGPKRDGQLVRRAETLPNVVLAGLRDYDEMPGAYAACDVLLSTSRVEWGGISRAMLEAKAVGRPVVALDRGDAASVADATVRPAPDIIVSALRSTV
jgi:glycosyltransferase involved in cell wall biosynthesis